MAPAKARDILICGMQYDHELREGTMSVLDLAPVAARLGVQGVEYREVYWKDKARELPALREQLRQLGLKATYATTTPLYSADPSVQAQLRQDLEDAHALGSPLLRVFRGEAPPAGDAGKAVVAAARAVVRQAGDYGMRLALENGNAGKRLADVRETLAQLASPVMGTNVDISNYAIDGQDPVAAIRALAPWIIYAHLKDVKQTPEGGKATYLGNGSLPLGDILAAFDATGRDFPFCFEFGGEGDPEMALTRSLAYMRRLMGQ